MSRYKEYYSKMSIEMKSWRSSLYSLSKKIKILENKLAPDLVGDFKGRVYTGTTQVKINKLKNLKNQYIELKNNRPEPKKSTAPKTRSKTIRTYSSNDLQKKFDKLSNKNKIDILFRVLESFKIFPYHFIFKTMGYTKTEKGWVKN